MPTQETKRQHFVPETYLKKFSVERKKGQHQIYASSKENIENIFPTNVSKVCVQNDLYTLSGGNEEERMVIENFYGDSFDSKYNEIFTILTNDTHKNISPTENQLIVSTIITMFFRTTRLITEFNDIMRRSFEDIIFMCQKTGKDYYMFEGKKVIIKGKSAKDLIDDYKKENRIAQVITQLRMALRLIELRKNNTISVVKIKSNEYEFITSDNPVTLFNFGSTHTAPFDLRNTISLPINKEYKVIIYPFENLGYISRSYHDEMLSYTEVLTTGYEQHASADKFILGSKKGLNGFLELKKKAEKKTDILDYQTIEIEKLKKIANDLDILP